MNSSVFPSVDDIYCTDIVDEMCHTLMPVMTFVLLIFFFHFYILRIIYCPWSMVWVSWMRLCFSLPSLRDFSSESRLTVMPAQLPQDQFKDATKVNYLDCSVTVRSIKKCYKGDLSILFIHCQWIQRFYKGDLFRLFSHHQINSKMLSIKVIYKVFIKYL